MSIEQHLKRGYVISFVTCGNVPFEQGMYISRIISQWHQGWAKSFKRVESYAKL